MKLIIALMLWLVLLVFAPVLAVALLLIVPAAWLLSLPVRAVLILVEAVFEFLRAVLLLPARVLRG